MTKVVCIDNQDYPCSLVVGRAYVVIIDIDAEKHGLIRVIDESGDGEGYLYPKTRFAPRIRAPRGKELEWAKAEAERLGLLGKGDVEVIDIRKRMDVLMAGPKRVGFNVVYDDANGVWLGRVAATAWSILNEAHDDRKYDIAAEGATPAEVLRKLAEMLE